MRFIVEIDTQNDAFQVSASGEVSRILHDIANRFTVVGIPLDGLERKILDANGNSCGHYVAEA